jgi:hypothetical protein
MKIAFILAMTATPWGTVKNFGLGVKLALYK